MKLVTYSQGGGLHTGILFEDKVYDMQLMAEQNKLQSFPSSIRALLESGEEAMAFAKNMNDRIKSGNVNMKGIPAEEVIFSAPVPWPPSCRDAYAFRQHVMTARRNRKLSMIPEFDEFPVFYFTNHNTICGPGDVHCMTDHFRQLDFELEWAVVIGRKGINIRAAEADSYIAGFMIMNDLSARTLQMEEMKLNLGPAKGKDFATATGPYLVTPDELENFKIPAHKNHTGNNYNLNMQCKVNGITVSQGNTGDMTWTFAEIIERCAYGAYLYPGDIIGSGTVGTGCFLELNGTGLLKNPDYKPQWLQPDDVIEMTISGLGALKNTVKEYKSDFSILNLKKQMSIAQGE